MFFVLIEHTFDNVDLLLLCLVLILYLSIFVSLIEHTFDKYISHRDNIDTLSVCFCLFIEHTFDNVDFFCSPSIVCLASCMPLRPLARVSNSLSVFFYASVVSLFFNAL